MPMWVWVLIGVGSFLCLSLLVGVALGRVLGQISELLYEPEDWSTMPIARDVDQQPRSPADGEIGRTGHGFEQAPV